MSKCHRYSGFPQGDQHVADVEPIAHHASHFGMQVAISILTLKSDADLAFLDGSGSYSQPDQYQHGMPNGLHCTAGVPTRSMAPPAHSVKDLASGVHPRPWLHAPSNA